MAPKFHFPYNQKVYNELVFLGAAWDKFLISEFLILFTENFKT